MDNSEAIRSMLDNMAAGKAAEVQAQFNDLLGSRINADLDQRRVEMSKNIFNNPELVKMGLADGEEHILDGEDYAQDSQNETGESNEDV